MFYGWWVLIAVFFIGTFGPMGRYALSALAPFIQNDIPLTKSEIGLAFSIHLWVYSFFVLLVGWLLDRVGSRKVMFVGGLMLLLSMALLSRLNSLWQLYTIFGVFTALGVSMTHYVPCQATVRRWFIKKGGLAAGITSDAMAVGSGVITPVLTMLGAAIGWRNTWLVAAPAYGVTIMLLAALVVRNSPESMGLHPDGVQEDPQAKIKGSVRAPEAAWSTREVLRTAPFWLLFVAHALIGIGTQGMLTQVVIWGVSLGAPAATAGTFMTAIALPSMFTKIFGGWLGDKYGKRKIITGGFVVSCLVMIVGWLFVSSPGSLLVMAVLFGVFYGVPMPLFAAYLGDLYGRKSLGMLVGIQVFGTTFVGGFGPLIWGRTADVTGSYNLACLISAVAYAIGLAALLVMKPVRYAKTADRIAEIESAA